MFVVSIIFYVLSQNGEKNSSVIGDRDDGSLLGSYVDLLGQLVRLFSFFLYIFICACVRWCVHVCYFSLWFNFMISFIDRH